MELVFSPLWTPAEAVCLSTPSLKAFLEEKGYKAHQTDLNIQIWNSIYSKEYMEHVSNRIDRELNELSRQLSLDRLESEKYSALLTARTLLNTTTSDVIEEARRTIEGGKKGSLFDIKRATEILGKAACIVSSVYYPTKIRFDSYLTRYYYDHSLINLMSAIENEKENFFIDIYQFYDIPRRILEKSDGVIGFSLGGSDQLIPSLTLANFIKKIDPNVFIVFGGPVLPYMGKSLEIPTLFQIVDAFVLGEGETPLYCLVDSLESNRSLEEVPNLVFRDSSGAIRKSETHSVEDVNGLPTPSFKDLDLDAYFNSARIVPLLTSRGCYWNRCAFCSLCSTYGSKYRERDIDLVVEDIRRLHLDYNVTYFLLNDESISAHRLYLLSDALLEEDLRIYWRALVRPEKGFSRNFFEKAYRAGCRIIHMGLESGSQRVLDLMEKGTKVTTAIQTIRNAHDAGVWTNVYVIFGFPSETTEDARMTTEVIVRHRDVIDSNPVSICRIEYGSKLYLHREKYGIRLHGDHDYNLIYCREHNEYDVVGGMSNEEVLKARDFHDQSIMEYPLYISNFKGVSVGNMFVFLGNRTRDEFVDIFVRRNIEERKHIKEEIRILAQKKGEAVISLLPDVVYDQVRVSDHDKKEVAQCIITNTKAYSFASIRGIFKDFLDLCDTQRTLDTIFTQLGEKYCVPKDRFMDNFFPVIKQLLRNGSFFTVH
ncbi:MAG: radical SAM protein [Theionarchaea archaeon]|nr:MAG: hypothetical protein AYK18_08700 [Theionarchaea archaeon DG-70]MBU7010937.1 radical SAM protein [Theionarchaea archaeon]